MKIDVIIPTFNRAHFLKRAVDSVLNQKYQNFNLIIINDGSTDNTKEILSKYTNLDNVFILNQENKGVSSARNLGIINSTSEWISFLDSDDEWLPNKLKVQVQYIEDYPDCNFIHTNEIWIRNGVRVNPKKKFDKSNHDIFRRSLETCLISPSTVILKRTLIKEMNYFDEDLKICEDYDLWIKIMLNSSIHFVPDYLIYKYGGHSDQLSSAFSEMEYWKVKSLNKILRLKNINPDKKTLLLLELEKKSYPLLAGLLKHEHLQRHAEILDLLKEHYP